MSLQLTGHLLRVVRSRLLVLGLGEALSRVFAFIAMGYLYRVLGEQHYGRLESTLAVMMFGTLLVEMGLSVVGAREVARRPAEGASLVGRVVSWQLLLALATNALLATVVIGLGLDPVRRRLLLGFGLSLILLPFSLYWLFQGRSQMLRYAAPRALRYAVFLTAVLLLVKTPGDVGRLPWAEVLAVGGMGLGFLLLYWQGGERLRLWPRERLDTKLLLEGLPVGGSNLIWALRMYLPFLLLDGLAGPAAVAVYGAAHRVLMVYQGGLDVYFTRLLPMLSETSARSRTALRRLLGNSLHLLFWPTVALALVVTWQARTIIGLIFGAPDAGVLLAVLFWLAPVLALRRHGRLTLICLGRQRAELLCSIAGVLLLLALLAPLNALYGAVGAAWAMLASEALATLLTWLVLAARLRAPEASSGETAS